MTEDSLSFELTNSERRIAHAANKEFAIAGFRASQTHLCKVEVQFSKLSLVLKLPAIATPQNVSGNAFVT